MKTLTFAVLAATAYAVTMPFAVAQPGPGGPHGAGPMGGPRMAMHMMERFDDNKDGKLTQDEIDAGIAQRYDSADTDKAGGVTIAEFEPAFWAEHREMMVRAFQFLDKNGDGTIQKDEVADVTGGIVARMDRNDDGALSREDRPRRWGKDGRKGHHWRHGPERGPQGDNGPAGDDEDDGAARP